LFNASHNRVADLTDGDCTPFVDFRGENGEHGRLARRGVGILPALSRSANHFAFSRQAILPALMGREPDAPDTAGETRALRARNEPSPELIVIAVNVRVPCVVRGHGSQWAGVTAAVRRTAGQMHFKRAVLPSRDRGDAWRV
jgi:hypothetical protein